MITRQNYLRFRICFQTPRELTDILKDKVADTEHQLALYYGWVYDSAWALALGLNNSLRYLNDSGLEGYTNNAYYLRAIKKGMNDVSFEGLSVNYIPEPEPFGHIVVVFYEISL